jgi:hypothetical protein
MPSLSVFYAGYHEYAQKAQGQWPKYCAKTQRARNPAGILSGPENTYKSQGTPKKPVTVPLFYILFDMPI